MHRNPLPEDGNSALHRSVTAAAGGATAAESISPANFTSGLVGLRYIGINHEIWDNMALEREIRTLKTKHNHYRNNSKYKSTRENYKLIEKVVAEKVVILEPKTKPRQV